MSDMKNLEVDFPSLEPEPDEYAARFQALVKERNVDVFLSEFQQETDRAAAVLGAAYLDRALEHLLRKRLLGGNKLKDELLNTDKPLGSFSARIKVAFAVGSLHKAAYHDLEIIRRIRNEFAHQTMGFSFQRPEIVSRCEQLQLPVWFSQIGLPATDSRIRFNYAVTILATLLIPAAEAMGGTIKSMVGESEPWNTARPEQGS